MHLRPGLVGSEGKCTAWILLRWAQAAVWPRPLSLGGCGVLQVHFITLRPSLPECHPPLWGYIGRITQEESSVKSINQASVNKSCYKVLSPSYADLNELNHDHRHGTSTPRWIWWIWIWIWTLPHGEVPELNGWGSLHLLFLPNGAAHHTVHC